MSAFGLMNIGASALSASQAALTTAGHNIANVNTAGYSRQTVELKARDGQNLGQGFAGRGVDVVTVSRQRDAFLATNAQQAESLSSADAIRAQKLSQLEQLFPIGENGLGAAAANLFAAFSDLQSMPRDLTGRTAVLDRADALVSRVAALNNQIGDMQSTVNEQLGADVKQINVIAGRIAVLNNQIMQYRGLDHSPNDLLDQRDQLVHDLNSLVQASTVAAPDGSLGVFIAGGQPLVLGSNASTLKVVTDPADGSQRNLVMEQSGLDLALNFQLLGGGEVAGLLRFQMQDLEEARNLIGNMALSIATVVNNQVALGRNMSDALAGPLFTIPPINGYAHPNNAGTATVQATVNDPTGIQLQASDYQITFTGAAAGTITRVSDGTSVAFASIAAPIHFDGLDFSLAAGAAAGDRFTVKPEQAAANISLAVTSAQQLGVTPLAFEFGLNNTGSLLVGSLRGPQQGATAASQSNPYLAAPVTLTFTAAGTFDVRGDGTGNPTAVAYTSGGTITYNGWSMVLTGTPVVGDTITLRPFAELGDTHTALLQGNTLSEAYASMLATVGTTVQGAQTQAKVSAAVASDAMAAATDKSGVNLDEEAAKLLQFQQSYQASAKILQVAQTVFDTLISAVSR